MGARVSVEYYDDLDKNAEATHIAYVFLWKDKPREIDLGDENVKRLEEFLAEHQEREEEFRALQTARLEAFLLPYRKASRAVGEKSMPMPPGFSAPAQDPNEDIELRRREAIRSWANRNGFKVSGMARIPIAVVDEYDIHGGADKDKSGVVARRYLELSGEEQRDLQAWVKELGYRWPWKSKVNKDRIALWCFESRDEAKLKEFELEWAEGFQQPLVTTE